MLERITLEDQWEFAMVQLDQSISNTLRTMLHTYPPNTIDQTNDIMDTCGAYSVGYY